jgi:cyclopropane-fatty-acyl-phospholipid synthase
LEDWHNLNVNYSRTLMAWMERFDRNREKIEALGYDNRFYRMWRFYLLSAAGSFSARRIHVWQVVLSKDGIAGGYEAIR